MSTLCRLKNKNGKVKEKIYTIVKFSDCRDRQTPPLIGCVLLGSDLISLSLIFFFGKIR